MVDSRAGPARGHQADDPRARWSPTARASRSTCSPNCAPRASCACASTARCTTSTPCPSWPRTSSTRSTSWWTGSRCGRTLKQRLAESFETALRHADGRAHRGRDGHRAASTCSRPSSPARSCGYALQELEPRLFSFNNPMGACPKCDGLGTISSSIRSASSPTRTLARRAARSRAGTGATSSTSRCCSSLAAHYGFDLERPFDEAAASACSSIVLYGSGDEKIPFTYLSERGRSRWCASTPSRASSPTSSGATARPTR